MDIISGIYKIVNNVNGKCYIGSAVDIKKRWSSHKSYLNNGKHNNHHLQRAWNLYGSLSFSFLVLEYCEAYDLLYKEQCYIDAINPEYNILPKAGSRIGYKVPAEVREKQSRSISEWWKSRALSDETRKKLSVAAAGNQNRVGCKHTEEARLKMSKSLTGRAITEEHKKKLSLASIGRFVSESTRAKLSEINSNRSEETRAKISAVHTGKKHSPEAKEKMRQSRLAYLKKKKEGT